MDTQKIIVLVLLVAVAAVDSKNFTIAGIKERLGKLFRVRSVAEIPEASGLNDAVENVVKTVTDITGLGKSVQPSPLIPATLETVAYVRPVRHGLLVAQDLAYSLIDGGMTEDDAAKLIDPVLPHLVHYKEGTDGKPNAN